MQPMKRKIDLQKLIHNRNFPILLILLSGLILGLFIFRDFGASGDEPNYYQYADSTLKAYSIRDRLAGTFDMMDTYGPADLRLYGPAYLVVGEGLHALLGLLFPSALSIELWHLANYLCFLLGVFFFYKLAQRWAGTPAATLSTLLFAGQPVLFGSAWINPKDMPLMVFFMGAIYLGLAFGGHAARAFGAAKEAIQPGERLSDPPGGIPRRQKKAALAVNGALCALALILGLGAPAIRRLITQTLLSINVQSPARLVDKLFLALVRSAGTTPPEYFVNKAIPVFDQFRSGFLYVTAVCLFLTLLYFSFPKFFQRRMRSFKDFLTGLKQEYSAYPRKPALILSFLGSCLLLGFACATRLVGPFAGLLVLAVWAANLKWKAVPLAALYGLVSIPIFFVFWPYLWQNTLGNLIYVLTRMSNFPDSHHVVFAGVTYSSRALPASFFPTLLLKTLTEPALLLIAAGLAALIYRWIRNQAPRGELAALLVWFFLPFGYILIARPNLYDNYRHLLFMLPALLLLSAFALEWIFQRLHSRWLPAVLALAVLFPGLLAAVQLHPYEYSYYNAISGGLPRAAHRYEVDYWMTCYKDLTRLINASEIGPRRLFVDVEPEIVSTYSSANFKVKKLDAAAVSTYPAGSLILLPLRWDHELLFPEVPIVYTVKLQGVDLCLARRVQ